MSFPDDAFTPRGADATTLHPPAVPQRLRVTARQIRGRFVTVNAATVVAMAGLNLTFEEALATPVLGRVTLGALLLALYGVVLIGSAAWYDRAFATRCDQPADADSGAQEQR
ncbi:MAG: hypothetical protein H5T76_11405 [Streptomyces sp.]|nr:hypothetical protein [Streptomyces sp.]